MQQTSTTPDNQDQPAPQQISRQVRRASLRDMNNKLLRDREMLMQEINRLQRSNMAMNRFLTNLSAVIGLTAPEHRTDGKNDADILLDRILGLVELEKRVKEKEEQENPLPTLKCACDTGYVFSECPVHDGKGGAA